MEDFVFYVLEHMILEVFITVSGPGKLLNAIIYKNTLNLLEKVSLHLTKIVLCEEFPRLSQDSGS